MLAPDEIVTEILLPAAGAGLRSSYRKVRARGSWDFALAGVALALLVKGARSSAPASSCPAWRRSRGASEAAEKALTGKALTPEVVAQAAEAAVAGAEPLEQNAYKVPVVKGTVTEALLALA